MNAAKITVGLLAAVILTSCAKTNLPGQETTDSRDSVMCTQEAKQCPNGKWVGRTGPQCEFKCD
jgi:hypothetical protein